MKFLQKIKSVASVLSVFLLFFVSCKKNTEDLQDLTQTDFLVKEQFFKTSNQLSQNLKSIVQKIKKQDSAYNFVPNLVKQIGYPNWEKVLESPRTSINGRLKSSDSSITLIPFNQNNSTTAFLACIQTTDSIYFNLETRNNLFNYNFFTSTSSAIKQKQIAKLAILANFEKKCNNRDSLLINNTYIKSIKNASINFLNNNGNGRSSGWVTKEIEICYTETVYEPIYPSGDPVGGFHYVERTTCTTYYVTDYTDEYDDPNNPGGNSNGWWNNGSGSGSGGGGGFPYEIIPDPNVLGNFVDDPNVFEDDPTQVTFDYDQAPWPTMSNVLSPSQFVEYDHRNCLALAKDQIAKAGLRDLGYGSAFKVYDANGGPYTSVAKSGINYIMTKLQSGKPVIVGVDNRPGTPSSVNADGKTDHFVTIVGSGQDSQGKYLTFYDNASNLTSKGCGSNNKLYYNESTGKITGYSAANGAPPNYYDYIVTQIRKNQ